MNNIKHMINNINNCPCGLALIAKLNYAALKLLNQFHALLI